MEGWTQDSPLIAALTKLRFLLQRRAPLRAGDPGSLDTDCLTAAGALVVERRGYASHKTAGTIRLIQLDDATRRDVEIHIRDIVSCRRGDEPFLLRGYGTRQEGVIDTSIVQGINQALQWVTGDSAARTHSLRAHALMNIAWDGVMDLVEQIMRGQPTAEELGEWVDAANAAWLQVATACLAAGHAGIGTAMLHYLSAWPFVLYAHATSLTLPRPASHHVLPPRTVATTTPAMTRAPAQRRVKKTQLPGMADVSAPIAPELQLIYLTGRILDMSMERVCSDFHVPLWAAMRLEPRLQNASHLLSAASQRARGAPGPRGITANQDTYRSAEGTEIVRWISNVPPPSRQWLATFALGLPCEEVPATMLTRIWADLLREIPAGCKVRIVHSRLHVSPEEVELLDRHKDAVALELEARHRWRRPEVELADRRDPSNRVRLARLSTLLRACLLAARLVKEQENEH